MYDDNKTNENNPYVILSGLIIFCTLISIIFILIFSAYYPNVCMTINNNDTIAEPINDTKKQLVVSCMFNGTGWGTNIESYNSSIINYYANKCALERGYFRLEEWAIS